MPEPIDIDDTEIDVSDLPSRPRRPRRRRRGGGRDALARALNRIRPGRRR